MSARDDYGCGDPEQEYIDSVSLASPLWIVLMLVWYFVLFIFKGHP